MSEFKAMEVRKYEEERDYEEICRWQRETGDVVWDKDLIPDTTFIVSHDGKDLVSISVMCPNSKLAVLEFYTGNPDHKGEIRREASKYLLLWLDLFCQLGGYKRMFTMAPNEKLKSYYEKEFGFGTTGQAFTMTREVPCL